MARGEAITVRDAAGERFDGELVDQEADGGLTVRGADGRRLILPADVVARRDGHDVHLTRAFGDIADASGEGTEHHTIPIVEEEAVVETRRRPAEGVRVHTHVDEREEPVEGVVVRETVDVERVSVDRYVDAPEPIREDGDTTIVPVYEEVLVVEKRLLLREEIHLTKRRQEHHERTTVHLKSERAEIERTHSDEA